MFLSLVMNSMHYCWCSNKQWLEMGRCSMMVSLMMQSTEDAEMLCEGLQYTTRHGRALTFSPVLERQVLQSVWRGEGSHELRNESF